MYSQFFHSSIHGRTGDVIYKQRKRHLKNFFWNKFMVIQNTSLKMQRLWGLTAFLQPNLPLTPAILSVLWKMLGQMFVHSDTLYKMQILTSWEKFHGWDHGPPLNAICKIPSWQGYLECFYLSPPETIRYAEDISPFFCFHLPEQCYNCNRKQFHHILHST